MGNARPPNPDRRTHGNLRDWGSRKCCRGGKWDAHRSLWSGAAGPAKFIGIA